jgi:hypothetical protein
MDRLLWREQAGPILCGVRAPRKRVITMGRPIASRFVIGGQIAAGHSSVARRRGPGMVLRAGQRHGPGWHRALPVARGPSAGHFCHWNYSGGPAGAASCTGTLNRIVPHG